MAKKRNSGSDSIVSTGAAPAREKKRTSHAKRSEEIVVAPAETPSVSSYVAAEATPAEQYVNHEAIARLAYSYWEARGFQGGSPEEDWLRAEQEIRNACAMAVTA